MLLEKARRINRLLQNSEVIGFKDIAIILRDVIKANIYIVTNSGDLLGHSFMDNFECNIMVSKVVEKNKFTEEYMEEVNSISETLANKTLRNKQCAFSEDTMCIFNDKFTTIVPIFGGGNRLGTLILAKFVKEFTDNDLLLSEYAATVLGIQILHNKTLEIEDTARKRVMVQVALSNLSYSELEAINAILKELKGAEGLLVASKIADKEGITRSVIVNALRKFESAGILQTQSLGMKGTHVKVLNDLIFETIKDK